MRVLDTPFLWWNNDAMLDPNDLRVFEGAAALRSFSAAARASMRPVKLSGLRKSRA